MLSKLRTVLFGPVRERRFVVGQPLLEGSSGCTDINHWWRAVVGFDSRLVDNFTTETLAVKGTIIWFVAVTAQLAAQAGSQELQR